MRRPQRGRGSSCTHVPSTRLGSFDARSTATGGCGPCVRARSRMRASRTLQSDDARTNRASPRATVGRSLPTTLATFPVMVCSAAIVAGPSQMLPAGSAAICPARASNMRTVPRDVPGTASRKALDRRFSRSSPGRNAPRTPSTTTTTSQRQSATSAGPHASRYEHTFCPDATGACGGPLGMSVTAALGTAGGPGETSTIGRA